MKKLRRQWLLGGMSCWNLLRRKELIRHVHVCTMLIRLKGLFYQKLPNSMYVQGNNKKRFKGTKQMKDKTRATAMICTAADGTRLPIAIIGKAKKPCHHVFDCLTQELDRLSHTRNKRMHGLIRVSHFGGSIVSSGLSI